LFGRKEEKTPRKSRRYGITCMDFEKIDSLSLLFSGALHPFRSSHNNKKKETVGACLHA
jgi:hypothetical protein